MTPRKYYYGALVLISHDRYVLDELVTTIWEVDDGKVKVYSGDYSEYIEQKKMNIKKITKKDGTIKGSVAKFSKKSILV